MERVCFTARVRRDRLGEYAERHQAVWSEMRAALRAAGWGNYSLFLTPDGLLIGYVETDDFDAALARMAATEVNARWQAEMADFFEAPEAPEAPEGSEGSATPAGRRPDEGFTRIDEIFHLAEE